MKRRWQYLQTNSTVHLARIFCRRPNSLPCPSVSIGIIANILINSHRSFSWSTLCLLSLYLLSRGPANASKSPPFHLVQPIRRLFPSCPTRGTFFSLSQRSFLSLGSLSRYSFPLSLSFSLFRLFLSRLGVAGSPPAQT